MPLFTAKLNEVSDAFTNGTGTVYLHTALPTDADPANGRTTTGGGAFATGFPTTAVSWTDASAGDVSNAVAFGFGTSIDAVGAVIGWSYYEGTSPVAYGTLPATTIGNGDSFTMPINSLQLLGSST